MNDVKRYDAMGAIVSADGNGYYIKASDYDALKARHKDAIAALERTLDRFKRILHRTTVRDVEETIAEADAVLKERA